MRIGPDRVEAKIHHSVNADRPFPLISQLSGDQLEPDLSWNVQTKSPSKSYGAIYSKFIAGLPNCERHAEDFDGWYGRTGACATVLATPDQDPCRSFDLISLLRAWS